MSIAEQKSQLAKLLATENVTVQHKKVDTASFNPKTRVLTCPIWKDMSPELYDLLMSHEVGHALNTPADGWHGAVSKKGKNYKGFLNVIEDARIEKKIKRRYPGLVKSYVKGFNEIMGMNLFGIQDVEEINELPFIDRVNIFTKSSYSMPIQFSNEELSIIEEIKNLETWNDVVAMTDRLWDQAVEEEKETFTMFDYTDLEDDQGDPFDQSEEVGDKKDDSDSDNSSEDSNQSIGENSDDEEESGHDEASDENADDSIEDELDDDEKDSSVDATSSHGDVDGDESYEPSCETDESFRNNENKLLDGKAVENVYVNIPKPKLDKILEDPKVVNKNMTDFYKELSQRSDYYFSNQTNWRSNLGAEEVKKLFNRGHVMSEFKKKNDRFISLMAKDFEMKKAATKYAKARLYTSGDIDINKIYKYKFDDQIFRKLTKLPKGKNHGMILVLDLSGSMDRNMAGSIEQILILTAFCKKVQIPFRVFGFTSTPLNRHEQRDITATWHMAENVLDLQDEWSLREFINSDMGAAAYKEAFENLLMGKSSWSYSKLSVNYQNIPQALHLSSTPLNESIVALGSIVPEFRQKHNLDIVNTIFVHDGDANHTGGYYTWGQKTIGSDRTTEEKANDWQFNYFDRNENVILQDTKIRWASLAVYHDRNNCITNDLLEWFKAKTGSQVFGFFVSTKMSDAINYRYVPKNALKDRKFYVNWEIKDEAKKLARKQKFLESYNRGFDQFYILNDSNKLTTDDEEFEFEVADKNKISTRSLASQFTKMNKSREVNRILATKFVEKIAVKL